MKKITLIIYLVYPIHNTTPDIIFWRSSTRSLQHCNMPYIINAEVCNLRFSQDRTSVTALLMLPLQFMKVNWKLLISNLACPPCSSTVVASITSPSQPLSCPLLLWSWVKQKCLNKYVTWKKDVFWVPEFCHCYHKWSLYQKILTKCTTCLPFTCVLLVSKCLA